MNKKIVDRKLKDYIWRHYVEDETFTLVNRRTGQRFSLDRTRRYSCQRAMVSANQRERVKRRDKRRKE